MHACEFSCRLSRLLELLDLSFADISCRWDLVDM